LAVDVSTTAVTRASVNPRRPPGVARPAAVRRPVPAAARSDGAARGRTGRRCRSRPRTRWSPPRKCRWKGDDLMPEGRASSWRPTSWGWRSGWPRSRARGWTRPRPRPW